MGVVLQANHAQVSSSAAATGATVFDGDSLATESNGTLQVRFGASQAYFLSGSSAVLHQSPAGFGATLTGGTIILSAADGETFRLLADGASIKPATGHATVGQVTMVNPTELVLISTKGALEVAMDGDVKTLPEGRSVRMVIQPADPASGPDPQGNGAPWSNGVTYAQGDVVSYNGNFYASLGNGNIGHNPGQREYWRRRGGQGGAGQGSGANPTGRSRFLWIALGLTGAGIGIALALALISPSGP